MPTIMHSLFSRRIVPSFVVDVSEFVDEKMSAISAYESPFYSAASAEPATRIEESAAFLRRWNCECDISDR